MGLIDSVRSLFATKAPRNEEPEYEIVFTYPYERGVFSTPSYRALVSEGARANGVVAPCVLQHYLAYAEPPLMAMKNTPTGRIPLADHPITKLLQHPNEQISGRELLGYISLFKSISGSCYLWKRRSGAGRPIELWPLSDAIIRPYGGSDKLVEYYLYTDPNGRDFQIPEEDIIHLKWMPDGLYPWRSVGPLQACLKEVDTDNEATRMVYDLLKNDCMPRNAIIVPAGAALSEDTKKRLKRKTTEEIGGKNRGKFMVLQGGADVKRISLDLREMETKFLREVPEARICANFRIPPVMVGVTVGLEHMTFSNYEEARKSFTIDTCVPMWKSDGDTVTQGLREEFTNDESVVVEFDTSQVASLAFINQQKRDEALKGLQAGGLLVNEFRAAWGLQPDPEGNCYLRGLALTPVPANIPQTKRGSDSGSWHHAGGDGMAWSDAKAKSMRNAKATVAALTAMREKSIHETAKEIDAFFSTLAGRVVERVMKGEKAARKSGIITDRDIAELSGIAKRQYVGLAKISWDVWNAALGVEKAFDVNDPAVVAALKWIGEDIQDISERTLGEVQKALEFGYDQGWGIDKIVRGDEDFGIRGLRDIVEETYAGRGENIARTELGTAQNMTSLGRYGDAGVKSVTVLDGDGPNSCEECVPLYGQVWTVEEALAKPLGHPGCVRGFAPNVEM